MGFRENVNVSAALFLLCSRSVLLTHLCDQSKAFMRTSGGRMRMTGSSGMLFEFRSRSASSSRRRGGSDENDAVAAPFLAAVPLVPLLPAVATEASSSTFTAGAAAARAREERAVPVVATVASPSSLSSAACWTRARVGRDDAAADADAVLTSMASSSLTVAAAAAAAAEGRRPTPGRSTALSCWCCSERLLAEAG